MHKTAQQLIREAYEAANGLPPASAALLKELASRLDISMAATSQACDERSAAINTLTATRINSGCPEGVDVQDWVKQLVAENVTMIRLLTDISENHVEYFSEGEDGMFAGVPLDYVSEINMYVSRDVNAENPFPATDAYLAGIKAEGATAAGDYLKLNAQHMSEDERSRMQDAAEICYGTASKLREVSANG
ncbi:TPA: hypothetical protein ACTW0G_000970 [Raoultella planticola]